MKSLDELRKIKERALEIKKMQEGQARVILTIGMATDGIAAGARETMKAIVEYIRDHELDDVLVTQTGYMGSPEHGPLVDVQIKGQPKVRYGHLKAHRVPRLMEQHVINGDPVHEWVLHVEEPQASSK
ncbi:(2Fe-2S) ferredoxin domain-containing protein [candidate division KSB3 bacterium]|jgi:NADP-reducing hydrogenase subunit HndB|uniref:(2Fe-2S) ferredoxin domain-containing protein n=1 Tax=candidate division KSB3 bacterium TaxID=2044937 RepID=A0A9D5Q5R3_9BACT|nr:(2Fe-2S) ferredoxin domain-containing protein [candidate division KSB3 bacterium]MBD3324900.1 (2Fe-2S) ferredoxin domain-containing protein [candidate division KSB3 bacterium]